MSTHPHDSNIVDNLISKAVEVFSIKGYEVTSINEITSALGVTRCPVYYHFKDKYGLYKAAFEYFDCDVRNSHARIVSQDKHIIEFIEDVIYDCAERNMRFGPNLFFGIETIEELSPIKILHAKLNQDIYQEKLDYVNRSKEKGEVRSDINPKHIADLIYLICLGLLNTLKRHMLDDYDENEIRDLIRILLTGIDLHFCESSYLVGNKNSFNLNIWGCVICMRLNVNLFFYA